VLLLLVSRDLGLGDQGYGWLLAGCGLGGILGAGVAARASDSRRGRLVLVGSLAAVAGSTVLFADPFGIGGALALAIVTGAGCIVVEILADTGLQRALAPDVLARAYGFAYPAAIAGIVAGSLIATPLVALFGLHGAFVVIGALVAAYALSLVRVPAPIPAPAAA
jgi:predicted MFS family arabinose efflux permease